MGLWCQIQFIGGHFLKSCSRLVLQCALWYSNFLLSFFFLRIYSNLLAISLCLLWLSFSPHWFVVVVSFPVKILRFVYGMWNLWWYSGCFEAWNFLFARAICSSGFEWICTSLWVLFCFFVSFFFGLRAEWKCRETDTESPLSEFKHIYFPRRTVFSLFCTLCVALRW